MKRAMFSTTPSFNVLGQSEGLLPRRQLIPRVRHSERNLSCRSASFGVIAWLVMRSVAYGLRPSGKERFEAATLQANLRFYISSRAP